MLQPAQAVARDRCTNG